MNSDNYKQTIRKKILKFDALIKAFDIINKTRPANVIFLLLFFGLVLYSLNSFKLTYSFKMLEMAFLFLIIFLLSFFFYFLNKKSILEKLEHFLFSDDQKYGPIKGALLFNFITVLFLSFISGFKTALMF